MRVIGTCLTSLLSLTACLGGGGGAGGGGAGGPAPLAGLNLPLVADPASFDTAEYRASGALPRIGAATLYATGGTGSGVTVGLIDTGIDTTHGDFAGALHPASIVAPFTLLVPITGLLSGYLVLGETIAPLEMAGGALIVLGIAISVFRRRRRSNTVPV